MKTKLKKLLSRPGYRYLLIGGSVYLLEVAIIIGAQALGANSVLAVGLSFWIGLIVSFTLQKFVTFGDKRTHHKILIPQIIAYSLLVALNFSFTLLVTAIVSPPVPAVIARTVALLITTIWNFYLYKTRIFKGTDELVY
ncbi:MAG TPA: GtrA family protein [Candidatus Binatia bacterium]|nr:GtrA family protein [Candidatus Binatia bacterium]